jgi:hypothetical protein
MEENKDGPAGNVGQKTEKPEPKQETVQQKTDKPSAIKENDKQNLLRLSEISLWLDTYDDIFSDFDPRPYSQRALSDDFLAEAKKASRGLKSGGIELRFLVPTAMRNQGQEAMIKKRLREHFRKHADMLLEEKKWTMKQGLFFVLSGILLMFTATYVLFTSPEKNFMASFLITLLEPAGWFMFWEGMQTMIFEPKKKAHDVEFYEKMACCAINFVSY